MSNCIWHNVHIMKPDIEGEYLTINEEGYSEVCIYSPDLYYFEEHDFDYLEEKEDRSGFCAWNDILHEYCERIVDFWTELPPPPDCEHCKDRDECEDCEYWIE